MAAFKNKLKASIKEDGLEVVTIEALNSYLPDTQFGYIENLTQRLNLIQFIYSNSIEDHQLSLGLMNSLWDNMILDFLIPEEKDVLFKWLRLAAESDKFTIDAKDLQFFQTEKIALLDSERITLSGF